MSGIDQSFLWSNVGVAVRLVQIAAYKDFEENARSFGQAPRYVGLLGLIETNPGLSQAQLAECIHLARASLVPILDKLTAEGVVERRLDANDKRIRRVWLTPKGRKLMARLNVKARQHEDRLLAGFTEEEKQTFLKLLRKADSNLVRGAADIKDVA